MTMQAAFLFLVVLHTGDADAEARRPKDDAELKIWLENMVRWHRFTDLEVAAATGLSIQEIESARSRFGLAESIAYPKRPADELVVLPYPGGRHPRIGFREGAVRPQRETKVSVFLPWEGEGYVVVDVPEAIFSNLGLTYLAHTHVPTLWTETNTRLPRLEWRRNKDRSLEIERELPNGIRFGAKVASVEKAVRMQLWLTNGTAEALSDLRVQNCVMLGGAPCFAATTNDNKVFRSPYVACRSPDGRRWIITAWTNGARAWANPPCPCLHSDPRFDDCPPGETRRVFGWLSFHEGSSLDEEIARIERTGWRSAGFPPVAPAR